MRSILLLFLGVPIPIILLLALCSHNFCAGATENGNVTSLNI